MKASLKWMVCALVALGAAPASAESDAFGLGTGRDGALRVTSKGTRVNRYAMVTWPLAHGDTVLKVASTAGFGPGDLVMVFQATGVVPVPAVGNPWPVELGNNPVGRWELARLAFVGGDTLVLTAPLVHAYAGAGTQVIRVPEYTHVSVERGGGLAPAPWDGEVGGVLALLVKGDLTNDGTIDATAAGFRGGLFVRDPTQASGCLGMTEPAALGAQKGEGLALTRYGAAHTGSGNVSNGGGGGVCQRSGGGGGGNGGPGGQGGRTLSTDGARDVGGLGGAMLAFSPFDHLSFGGGGGAGHGNGEATWLVPEGGRGGGIVFIRGGRLLGRGEVLARGEMGGSALEDGAGGGGAGGSIYLRLAGSASCGRISASGGVGGSSGLARVGPGGGGGGGRVLFQASGSGCPASLINAHGGQAGSQPDDFAQDGATFGAQPGAANAGFYNGIVTVLAGGFAAPPPPRVTGMPGAGVSGSQVLTGSGRPDTEVVVYVDGVEVGRTRTDASGRYTFTLPKSLQPGDHRVQVATASQGVVGAKGPSRSFTTNFTRNCMVGKVCIEYGPELLSNSRTATFIFSGSNTTYECAFVAPLANLTCAPNNSNGSSSDYSVTRCGALGGTTNTARFDLPADGLYCMGVRQTDVLTTESTYLWRVDTTAPTISISTGPSNPTNLTSATVTYTVTDTVTSTLTLECRIYEALTTPATFGACTSTTSHTASIPNPPPDGQVKAYIFDIKATDAAGNTNVASYRWTVDRVAPTVAISGPSGAYGAQVANFVASSTSPDVESYECKFDTGSYAPCASAFPSPSYAEGTSHTVYVKAKDRAGNESTPATLTWYVDMTAPVVSLSPVPADPTNTTTPTVGFSASDVSAKDFKCRLFAAPATVPAFGNCTTVGASGETVSGTHGINLGGNPSSGDYIFELKVTDAAGNVGVASYRWTEDFTKPDVVLSGPSGAYGASVANFTATSTANDVASYECKLDANPFSECPSTPTTGRGSFSITINDGLPHTLQVRAKDRAGNVTATPASRTWYVDTAAPVVSLTSVPANPTNATNPSVTFSATDSSTMDFDCRMFAASVATRQAFGDCTTVNTPNGQPATGSHSINLSSLPSGTVADYIFELRVTDAAGNSGVASYRWTEDFEAPDVVLVGPSGAHGSQVANFTATSTANDVALYECRLGSSGGFSACPSQPSGRGAFSYTFSDGASRTLYVRAKDRAGNHTDPPVSLTWTVDTTAPTVSLTSVPQNPTNNTHPSIGFSATDASELTFECRLYAASGGGQSFGTCATEDSDGQTVTGSHGVDLSAVPAGTVADYIFELRVTDAAGNSSVASYRWREDFQPPVTLLSGPSGPVRGGTVSFAATSPNTDVVAYECKLDEATSFTPCPSSAPSGRGSFEYTFGDGTSHTLEVRARDAAGNVDESPETRQWRVDLTPPDTSVSSAQINSKDGSKTELVTFTASSTATDVGVYECLVDGASEFQTCPGGGGASFSYTFLDGTSHVLLVRAKDTAGNVDASPARIDWNVDTTAPNTFISETIRPEDPTDQVRAVFAFSASEPNVTYECKLDTDADFSTCTNPAVLDVVDGERTLQVRAIDLAGNPDTTPASYTWNVDSSLPVVRINGSTVSSVSAVKTAQFTFDAPGLTGVNFRCKVDLGAFEACTSPYTTPLLTDGVHTFEVRAVNGAGVEGPPERRNWRVDTQKPIVDFTRPLPPSKSNSRTAQFYFVSNESPVNFRCGLNPEPSTFKTCPSGFEVPVEQDGTYTLYVQAVDEATNLSSVISTTWEVYTEKPPLPVVTSPRHESFTKESVIMGTSKSGTTVKVKVDGVFQTPIIATDKGTWSFTGDLRPGEHTVTVTAVDDFGNESDPSPVQSFIVDNFAPTVEFVGGPKEEETVYKSEVTFRVKGSDDHVVARFECSLNNETPKPCGDAAGAISLPPLLERANYRFDVWAVDAAENRSKAAATRVFHVDLGGSDHGVGGGVTCSSTGSRPPVGLLGLGLVMWLIARRRAVRRG